jgi:hypothetical protein
LNLSSKSIALVGVFAALHAMLYLSYEIWRSWSIYLEPIEGVILGPWIGFLSAFIGSVVGRAIKPTPLWMFGIIAEPLGVLACGLIVKKQWKPLLAVYAFMLGAYFMHPLGRELPLWTILDILAAFVLIYPAARLSRSFFEEDSRHLFLLMPLVAFIGAATDALARVFLLIPAGLYAAFGWSPEQVYAIFITGAMDSYKEDIIVVIASLIVIKPLLAALKKLPGIKYPLS